MDTYTYIYIHIYTYLQTSIERLLLLRSADISRVVSIIRTMYTELAPGHGKGYNIDDAIITVGKIRQK